MSERQTTPCSLEKQQKIEQIDSDQKENTGNKNHGSSVPTVHSFVHSHFHFSDEESER